MDMDCHMEHAYAYGLICLKIGYQAKQQLILSKLELKLFMVPYWNLFWRYNEKQLLVKNG